jgi:heme/copper-type cytochrome/quinol oxidase subunit 1
VKGPVDIYIHDTMYVISWQVLVVAGSLVLGAVAAVIFLIAWALGGVRRKP